MKGLATVTRLEMILYCRGRTMWVATAVMIVLGLYVATWARTQPDATWGLLSTTALWLSLALTFAAGDGINRDREYRVDGVLLSTPVDTAAYIWGKYCAAVIMILALAGISLMTAILTDDFAPIMSPGQGTFLLFGHVEFPPLGPWPYLTGWFWLVLTPLLFGAAFVLASITLARGLRLLAYVGALVIWAAPTFGGSMSEWLDAPAYSLTYRHGLNQVTVAYALWTHSLESHGTALTGRVVHVAVQHLPPHFPTVFYWNRAFFLSLTIVLVSATAALVGRRRRGLA